MKKIGDTARPPAAAAPTPTDAPEARAPQGLGPTPGADPSLGEAGSARFGRGWAKAARDAAGALTTSGRSVFAHLVRGGAPGVEDLIGPLPRVGAQTITELVAKLPVQAEIGRIEAALADPAPKIPYRPFEAMKADLPRPYVDALERLPQLTARFNPVELYTADDISAVKEAFLEAYQAGARDNPVFSYTEGCRSLRRTLAADGTSPEAIRGELDALRARVLEAAPPDGDDLAAVMRQAILRKIDDDVSTLDLLDGLERRDDATVKAAFARKYGAGVDDRLHDAAKTVFAYLVETQAHANKRPSAEAPPLRGEVQDPELRAALTDNEGMTAGEFEEAVHWMLNRYYAAYEAQAGAPFPEALKYTVEIDPKYSAIDVRDKSSEGPIIGIPDKARSVRKYLELLRHEIDCHARQSLNGHFMFGFGGGALKVDEETWYEGLAKFEDTALGRDMFGDDSQPTMPYYPLAIRMAEEGKSFVEVFEAMLTLRKAAGSGDKTALSNAWNTAYRVFRGHADTSNPHAYAMPKDQAYLRGWMLQTQLVDRGLSHLNEAAIGPPDGPERLARFDFGPDDLMFPDIDLTRQWYAEVGLPRVEARLAAARAMDEDA